MKKLTIEQKNKVKKFIKNLKESPDKLHPAVNKILNHLIDVGLISPKKKSYELMKEIDKIIKTTR